VRLKQKPVRIAPLVIFKEEHTAAKTMFKKQKQNVFHAITFQIIENSLFSLKSGW